ncbi:MAG: N-acetylmuramoyl-L-alanine amidase [Alphaproteobacteria bacterium]|nr:N-acetylmuramoyl-L-alanine amidase [Alphaproteobacteria bacterium]MCB9695403.1 N-acetylmuramoyl-L-alanine amidase [Alphaproteobacteria bacterium]
MWTFLLACTAPPPEPLPARPGLIVPPPAAEARWPQLGAPIRRDPPVFPEGFGQHVVMVDPGHGTGGNQGAISCWCTEESAYTLRASRALAEALEATGHFRVLLARHDEHGPSYRSRIAAAVAGGAEALLGIHADVRGEPAPWEPSPGLSCRRMTTGPGFSVLWSRRAPTVARADGRRDLARALARRLAAAGPLPYDGADYEGLYETDTEVPGVFRDLRGLLMLYEPPIPAVIVETHHALDPAEVARWSEPETEAAFADAVAGALIEVLGGR